MKQPSSKFFKQQGFTLIECLVALVIFSLIILGSGTAVSRMLNMQKDMNLNAIILNTIQTRLQNASSSAMSNNICSSIDLSQFVLANKTYYVGCASESMPIANNSVAWPILAVSDDSQNTASACASGTAHVSCYVVGR